MTRTFFAATALLATAMPSIAIAADSSFTRDGETYVYTATPSGDTTLIEGHSERMNSHFRLRLRDGRVTGTSGGKRVSFRVPQPSIPTELTQR